MTELIIEKDRHKGLKNTDNQYASEYDGPGVGGERQDPVRVEVQLERLEGDHHLGRQGRGQVCSSSQDLRFNWGFIELPLYLLENLNVIRGK